MAGQLLAEEVLAEGDALLLVEVVEASALPDLVVALDDEGAAGGVERVGVGLKEAVFGLFEDEGEGIEDQVGPEPGELGLEGVKGGPSASEQSDRTRLLTPSAPTITSESENASRLSTSTPNRSSTPSSWQRRCSSASSSLREIAEKAWPARANQAALVVDLDRIPPREAVGDRDVALVVASRSAPKVSSEKTTPHPKVASGAFRSYTVISWPPSSFFIRIAK